MADWKSEVEWGNYHPGVGEYLDDELFWTASDEQSPNGSDPGWDAEAFLTEWFAESGEAALSADSYEKVLNQLEYTRDDVPMVVNEASADDDMIDHFCKTFVGLAFAHYKIKGHCPTLLRDEAQSLLGVLHAYYSSEDYGGDAAEWTEKYSKMSTKLSGMPHKA